MTKTEDKLYGAVVARVQELQRKATDESTRYADVPGRLARLRRAIRAEPGSVPDVWSDTIGSLPEDLWGRGLPSPSERAAHTAITLFAWHVQAASGVVHKSGISMGAAVRRLASARSVDPGGQDRAVFKRFQILATASPGQELNHHLRSMITLMRAENVQLDYGRLAVDIAKLSSPQTADQVRLRWGRDYHRVPPKADTETVNPTETD